MNESQIPSLILGAAPKGKVQLPDSFYEKGGDFFNLLQNMEYLRRPGWNLRTLDIPRLKNGEFWEVKNAERKIIRLYSDGSLITAGSIDRDFLGWVKPEDPPELRALSIVEYTYEFVDFYRRILKTILKLDISIDACVFKVGIKNLQNLEGGKLKLYPYSVKDFNYHFRNVLGDGGEIEKDFMIPTHSEDLLENTYDSKYIAYKLVVLLFRQFQITTTEIPYTKTDEENRKFIDVEQIKKLG